MAHGKACEGKKTDVGKYQTVHECASQCKGKSMMFIFGTNHFGKNKCKKKYIWRGHRTCPCYCETESSVRGECSIVQNKGYNLYRFSAQGEILFYIEKREKRSFISFSGGGRGLPNFFLGQGFM